MYDINVSSEEMGLRPVENEPRWNQEIACRFILPRMWNFMMGKV
jgi:hypothetical protein